MIGHLYVVAAPSGAGKTTLVRLLFENDPGIRVSVSTTTRAPRPGEEDGREYHFVAVEDFLEMVSRGDFLEWAEVHGNYYGTPQAPVEEALASGRDVLFDIDWQGAAQLRDKMSADVVSVFILPPSMAELRSRLTRRAEDAPEVIEKRLVNARREIAEWPNFDYVVVNDDLDAAFADLSAILRAERSRRSRAAEGIEGFVGTLLA